MFFQPLKRAEEQRVGLCIAYALNVITLAKIQWNRETGIAVSKHLRCNFIELIEV